MTRSAFHKRRVVIDNPGDYQPDTFCVSSEARWFFDLWRRGHNYERLRLDIMPHPLMPTTIVSRKRMQVLERFEWLVRRAEREERAA